jgi:hypothetical protein
MSHLAFGQPVSHCLIIGELIPARGLLLREIKKEAKEQILVNLIMTVVGSDFYP